MTDDVAGRGVASGSGLFAALLVGNDIAMAGVLAGARPAEAGHTRLALLAFAAGALFAAAGGLMVWYGQSRPITMAATATENPGDYRNLELLTAVISVVAGVVGAIASALGF